MADRFWVGGSNSWATSANWSATSGGAGGAGVPTSADNVFFDANSSAGSYTVTFSSSPTCANITIGPPASGTLTLSGFASSPLNIYGSWTSTGTRVVCASAYSTGALGTINFLGTGTQTITMGGLTIYAFGVNYNGNGSFVHTDDFYNAAATGAGALAWCGTSTLTLGTIDVSAGALYKVTVFKLGVNSNVRTIAFGTNQISLSGVNTTVLDVSYGTNFSYTGTGGFTCVGSPSSGTRSVVSWSGFNQATSVNLAINGGTDTVVLNNTNGAAFGTLDFTGFSGTWAYLAATMNLFGSVYLSPTMTLASGTPTRYVFFKSTNAGATYYIKSAGKTWPYSLTMSSSANYTLFDNCVANVPGVPFQHSGGNLVLNDKNLYIDYWQGSGSGNRGFNFGNTGAIIITGSGKTVWNQGIAGTFNTIGNSNIHLTYSGNVGTRTLLVGTSIATNQNSYPSFIVDDGSDTVSFQGYYNNITFANTFAGIGTQSRTQYGNLTLSSNVSANYAGAHTITFAGANNKVLTNNGANTWAMGFSVNTTGNFTLADNFTAPSGAITLAASPNFDLSDRNITAYSLNVSATTGNFLFGNPSVISLVGNNSAANVTVFSSAAASNLVFSGTANIVMPATGVNTGGRFIAAGASAVSGGTFNFQVFGTDLISATGSVKQLDLTNTAGNVMFGAVNTYGNVLLGANTTMVSGGTVNYFGSGNRVLDTAGLPTTNFTLNVALSNSSIFTLPYNFTSNSPITCQGGVFEANDKAVTASKLTINGTANLVTVNMGDNTWTLTGSAGVLTLTGTNPSLVSVNANSSTIYLSTDTAARTVVVGPLFAPGANNAVFNNVVIGGNTANSSIAFSGNLTCNSLSSTKTGSGTIRFGATNTVTVGSWGINGSEGNVISIRSADSKGVAVNAVHYLNFVGNGNANVQYLDIAYSSASPTNTWYSLLTNNNVDSGNNSGWIFLDTGSSNFFLVF